jgi:hypothetical protein
MTETDFDRWNEEVTVPPVRDSLRLCDYLSAELQAEFLKYSNLPPEFLSYTWLLEEKYDKVVRWVKALVSAAEASLSVDFLTTAIADAHNHDRAFRAAAALKTEPVRREDIPRQILKMETRLVPTRLQMNYGRKIGEVNVPYVLTEKAFEWSAKTPPDAVDAVALLLLTETPDRLWMAEYVEQAHWPQKWDPIIYAQYGNWQVEVARWD